MRELLGERPPGRRASRRVLRPVVENGARFDLIQFQCRCAILAGSLQPSAADSLSIAVDYLQ